MTKGINTTSFGGVNDTIFAECFRLSYYSGPMEDWMVATNVLHIAINAISALITLVANTVFLVTYFKTPSLRTSHNFFLMLLAITDISVGLVTQPLFIARKIMEIYRIHSCALWGGFQATLYYFSGISLLTITLVSSERYLAVCRPIKHRNAITPHRMAILAFTVWAVWLPFPILRLLFSEFYKALGLFVCGIILVLFTVNVFIYVKIYRSLSQKKCENFTPEGRKVTRERQLIMEARLAKTAVCLMVIMILAYLPFFLAVGYKAVAGVNTAYLFGISPFASTSVLLNSSFNPLFYCFRNTAIREAIRMRINGIKPKIHGSTSLQESFEVVRTTEF